MLKTRDSLENRVSSSIFKNSGRDFSLSDHQVNQRLFLHGQEDI